MISAPLTEFYFQTLSTIYVFHGQIMVIFMSVRIFLNVIKPEVTQKYTNI